jgi:hypothetical protein
LPGRDGRVRCKDAGSSHMRASRGDRGRCSAPPSVTRRHKASF